MNKREEERKIIKEIIEYAYDKNIEHDANYEEIEKIREWISKIVELEAEEMGYKTRVILGEINIEKLRRMEDKGELILRFSRNNIYDETGYFAVNTSKDFSTPRVPELYINENYHEYVLENHKETPIDPFISICDNAFHELRHMRQYLMAQTGVSSYISLIYAKEKFIIERYHKIYKKNHDSMRIEEDAEIESSKNWKEVYEPDRRLQKRYTSLYKIGITKRRIQRDDFAFNMFDKLMKKEGNRYILKVFPVLQKEYNEDGTKKSLNQLLENMKSEIEEILNMEGLSDSEKDILMKDCKGMYFEILYREMKKKSTLLDITCLAEAYDKENNTLLFSEMKSYFQERYKSEKQDIKETGFEEQEKEVESRGRYYQTKIDFLDLLAKQQQNDNFLKGIINKGKKFVRIRKNKFII